MRPGKKPPATRVKPAGQMDWWRRSPSSPGPRILTISVRERGPEALKGAVRAAKGILEHLDRSLARRGVRTRRRARKGGTHPRGSSTDQQRGRSHRTLDGPNLRRPHRAAHWHDRRGVVRRASRCGHPRSFAALVATVSRGSSARGRRPRIVAPAGTGGITVASALARPRRRNRPRRPGLPSRFPRSCSTTPAAKKPFASSRGTPRLCVAAIAAAHETGQKPGHKFSLDVIEILAHVPAVASYIRRTKAGFSTS